MASVLRDQNRVPVWWGLSSVDGVTPIPIAISSATNKPLMEIGTSVSAVISLINGSLPRDENRIPCVGGQSSSNGTIIIPLSVNPSTGAILAQTI